MCECQHAPVNGVGNKDGAGDGGAEQLLGHRDLSQSGKEEQLDLP